MFHDFDYVGYEQDKSLNESYEQIMHSVSVQRADSNLDQNTRQPKSDLKVKKKSLGGLPDIIKRGPTKKSGFESGLSRNDYTKSVMK